MCTDRKHDADAAFARLVPVDLDEAEPEERIPLQPVEAVTITSLVDNVSDILMSDRGPARRPPRGGGPTRPCGVLMDPGWDVPVAEHGFSALVTITDKGREHRILFDAGVSPDGMVGNMRRLGVAPEEVEAVVLSHGHFDHTSGLDGFIRAVGRTNLPVIIHPEFWNQRRVLLPGKDPVVLPTTSRRALEGAGFDIIERRQPSFLLDRSVLITGEVDRTTTFEQGFRGHQALRDGIWESDPLILDDQALIVHVRGKGLVVLTGCGHAGVVNLMRYARRLTGVERVYCVMGGFHLTGAFFESLIPPTVTALAELAPEVVVPAHCTGWKAQHAIAARLPDAFIPNSVRTRYDLCS